jgi:flagellar M-ring protein FliF
VILFMEMWNRLTKQAKTGIVIGAGLIATFAIGLGVWAYRTDYQVLFSDISARDAASMTAELEHMKIPYQLSDGGNTILVPKEMVYQTRLKLMGKDLPLHGAVGFEVFNNADFGMTEFVQKVNYQRAVQGELTRTILSIEDIQSARVHLAVAEQGLFKKATSKPKAAVTLVMKQGRILAPDQVTGIQRLVAASVPDILAADVTVLDQHGVALTRVVSPDGGAEFAGAQLDLKRGTEEYLLRKITQILDRTFGSGEAIASVDVALNLDQNRVTTEDVLPAKSTLQEGSPTGVVVRERQTTRENGTVVSAMTGNTRDARSNGATSLESDYQVGRRVEQMVTAPGTTRRMTIAVVVKRTLDEDQIEKLKEVIGLAAGFNKQRGDAVVVYSLDKLSSAVTEAMPSTDNRAASTSANENAEQPVGLAGEINQVPALPRHLVWTLALLIAAAVAAGAFYIWTSAYKKPLRQQLSHADREQLLSNVRLWIQGPAAEQVIGNRK